MKGNITVGGYASHVLVIDDTSCRYGLLLESHQTNCRRRKLNRKCLLLAALASLVVIFLIASITLVFFHLLALVQVIEPEVTQYWIPQGCDRATYFRYNGCNQTKWTEYQRTCRAIREILSPQKKQDTGKMTEPDVEERISCIEDEILDLDHARMILQTLRNQDGSDTARAPDAAMHHRTKRAALLYQAVTNPWPMTIPYQVDGTIASIQDALDAVKEAISAWNKGTCLNFVEIPANLNISTPSILFTYYPLPMCSSYIGKSTPSSQPIYLGFICYARGTISHEIGHALGLIHEHQRPDRDQYVQVRADNEVTGSDQMFMRFNSSYVYIYDSPYDYTSDMHYSNIAYSKNNLPTLETADPLFGSTIGQRQELSFLDLFLVNSVYCSDVCRNYPLESGCLNSGYQDPNDCSRCRCPTGWAGKFCDQVAPPVNATCGGHLVASYVSNSTSTPYYKTGQGYYNTGQECSWLIEAADAGQQVTVEFNSNFGLYCNLYDASPCIHWVEIRYKSSLGLPGPRYCCKKAPGKITSESGKILIYFQSKVNGSNPSDRTGFSFTYYQGSPTSPSTTPLLSSTSLTTLTSTTSPILMSTTSPTTLTTTSSSSSSSATSSSETTAISTTSSQMNVTTTSFWFRPTPIMSTTPTPAGYKWRPTPTPSTSTAIPWRPTPVFNTFVFRPTPTLPHTDPSYAVQ